MRIQLVPVALIVAACGGGAPRRTEPPVPASSAQEAVRAFLQAAADSNVTRMGDLWGTSRGPANATHAPPTYEKQLIIMQIYLRGDSIRVLSDVPNSRTENVRDLAIQLYRGTCVKQIPVAAVRTSSGGWLVQNIDLGAAGNPARPCP